MEYGVWIKLGKKEPHFLKSEYFSVHQTKEDWVGKTQTILGTESEFI